MYLKQLCNEILDYGKGIYKGFAIVEEPGCNFAIYDPQGNRLTRQFGVTHALLFAEYFAREKNKKI